MPGQIKHGKSASREYQTWGRMIQRCTNPRHVSYPRYGGIGVTVCNEWLRSFESFFRHVGPRPSDGHSIDRKDSTKGYEPGNVRWATRQQQNRNRRQGLITVNGVTRHTWEWAELTGLTAAVIARRIGKGMAPERAISRPVGKWTGKDGGGLTREQRSRFASGERCHLAKLNDDLVRQIRSLKRQGARISEIAKMLNLVDGTVGDVINGRTWKHVED